MDNEKKYLAKIKLNNSEYEIKDAEARALLNILFEEELIIDCGTSAQEEEELSIVCGTSAE